jgi:hypothetical protein
MFDSRTFAQSGLLLKKIPRGFLFFSISVIHRRCPACASSDGWKTYFDCDKSNDGT